MTKVDILAFAAHPDDVELACGALLYKASLNGKSCAIVDLTQGEMGTRGTPKIRLNEANRAAEILNLKFRENLNLGDVWFEINADNLKKIVYAIRKYQPEIILANALKDRHPDHSKAAKLVKKALFLANLTKIVTYDGQATQSRWKAKAIFHYIQFQYSKPSLVFPINKAEFDVQMQAVKAYNSQFFQEESNEPRTLISDQKFFPFLEARAREFGAAIEEEFGIGLESENAVNAEFLNYFL